MSKRRLLELIRVLRNVEAQIEDAKKHGRKSPFRMNNWCQVLTDYNEAVCGTAACAAGHAASDGWFRSSGLRLEVSRWRGLVPKFSIEFRGASDEAAVRRFFGLSVDDTEDVFFPMSYEARGILSEDITPQHVIDRVNILLRRKPRKRATARA